MKVIAYYPKTAGDIKDMQENVAEIHAKAVISHLNRLSLDKEQIDNVLNGICNKVNDE